MTIIHSMNMILCASEPTHPPPKKKKSCFWSPDQPQFLDPTLHSFTPFNLCERGTMNGYYLICKLLTTLLFTFTLQKYVYFFKIFFLRISEIHDTDRGPESKLEYSDLKALTIHFLFLLIFGVKIHYPSWGLNP